MQRTEMPRYDCCLFLDTTCVDTTFLTLTFCFVEFSNNYPLYCLVDCVWDDFGDWSSCSKSCGSGQKSRTRSILTPSLYGGHNCEGKSIETATCNNNACPIDCEWGKYGDWSSCSKTCGGGDKSRSRSILNQASNGGKDCEGEVTETTTCNNHACSIDCEWGPYDMWSSCSKSCGGGVKSRSRSKVKHASNGGKQCQGKSTEITTCSNNACPIDCEWGSYGEWSSCSKSCGGGDKLRSRSKARLASNGGKECVGPDTERSICGQTSCPGSLSQLLLFDHYNISNIILYYETATEKFL